MIGCLPAFGTSPTIDSNNLSVINYAQIGEHALLLFPTIESVSRRVLPISQIGRHGLHSSPRLSTGGVETCFANLKG